jgi:DNA-binding response OmpR family regulator
MVFVILGGRFTNNRALAPVSDLSVASRFRRDGITPTPEACKRVRSVEIQRGGATPLGVPVQQSTASALVVTSELQLRSTIRRVLTGIGFDVSESEHGRHALSVLQAKPCLDLLITEAQPPDIDGKRLAESFMEACPLGRAILVSDHPEEAGISDEGGGSWFVLPKQRLPELLVEALRKLGLAHPKRVILLAEDEKPIRHLLQTILTKAGHAVIVAADGQEALELSRAYIGSIDLVLSDVVMPHMTGRVLAQIIGKERPTTRILLMSGHTSGVLHEFATSRNFIRKPFIPKSLLDKITELLDRSDVPETPEEF